ncbi:hypothetical protein RIF29_25027 [Crotalaria pallida]|uniref:Uncharacterized protein n=1 Tax=Crotalaria pallida TaxID=3830 RepID=A0AAN9I0Q4_CROPI
MGFRITLPFSGLIRQFEQEMETVVKVLQPGPLGIIEHKFSADEIRKANATVSKAVANWRTNAILEDKNHILKDYIQKLQSSVFRLQIFASDLANSVFESSHNSVHGWNVIEVFVLEAIFIKLVYVAFEGFIIAFPYA